MSAGSLQIRPFSSAAYPTRGNFPASPCFIQDPVACVFHLHTSSVDNLQPFGHVAHTSKLQEPSASISFSGNLGNSNLVPTSGVSSTNASNLGGLYPSQSMFVFGQAKPVTASPSSMTSTLPGAPASLAYMTGQQQQSIPPQQHQLQQTSVMGQQHFPSAGDPSPNQGLYMKGLGLLPPPGLSAVVNNVTTPSSGCVTPTAHLAGNPTTYASIPMYSPSATDAPSSGTSGPMMPHSTAQATSMNASQAASIDQLSLAMSLFMPPGVVNNGQLPSTFPQGMSSPELKLFVVSGSMYAYQSFALSSLKLFVYLVCSSTYYSEENQRMFLLCTAQPLLEYTNKVFYSRRKKELTHIECVLRAAMNVARLAVLNLVTLEYRVHQEGLIHTYALFQQGLAHRFFTIDSNDIRWKHDKIF
ncbi:hypothetical protein CSKR_111017 [Clonorchis sinensis]|uniref:Uncharacterized protein n=1 Tax=Clonorchis sinensis TaxID=79923 RepID=A0A419PJZ1_CLOSI|nr:hypothetical protein CSKR_111017 [Clonorchis sinensis]